MSQTKGKQYNPLFPNAVITMLDGVHQKNKKDNLIIQNLSFLYGRIVRFS